MKWMFSLLIDPVFIRYIVHDTVEHTEQIRAQRKHKYNIYGKNLFVRNNGNGKLHEHELNQITKKFFLFI